VCGEMAADPVLLKLLVGLGLREFSMAPSAIPLAKRVIRGLSAADARIAAGRALRPGKPLARTLAAPDVEKALTRGTYSRPTNTTARFAVGDRVRTKNLHPTTHTRLPRYARGRMGVIECVRGFHVFPDTVAIGQGENPQWLYTVLFEGRELWGENADPELKVSIEAWEPYLEPA